MEKKVYIAPEIEQQTMEDELPLCQSPSGVTSTGDAVRGIGYGGVDKGGTVEPSAKKRFDEFCDELDNTDNWLH